MENIEKTEYVSEWRVDGERELVAAVVLYFHHVDKILRGGNMELLDRTPMGVLNSEEDDSTYKIDNKRAIVPVKTGTLLVFSNYQMAHRVLRMVNQSTEQSASRFCLSVCSGSCISASRSVTMSFDT